VYIPEHDGELQDALRVIAETRKMLELGGNVAGLESLNHALAIQRDVIQASTVRASAIAWRRLYNDVEAIDLTEARMRQHMSARAYKRIWRALVTRLLFRAIQDRKDRP
jgi:hypothetical protein